MPDWREFKLQSRRAKIHLSITVILLILSVILACLLGHYFKRDPEYELCHTKQCVAAAHHILSFIDESVDPCDNFYEFMCGNYIANLTYDAKGIPTSRQFNFENVKHQMLSEHLDRDDEYYELSNFGKKRMFYNKCLDVNEIEKDNDRTFKGDLMYVMGGWPLSDWQLQNVIPWKDVMLRAREYGMKYDFFFNIDVYHNEYDNKFHIEIAPPSEDYMTGPVFSSIFKRENINTILGMAKYWSDSSVKTTYHELEEAIIFAKNLSNKVVESNKMLESEGSDIMLVPISDINEHVGAYLYSDWLGFLKNFTHIESLQSSDLVVLKFPSGYYYFEQLVNLLNRAHSYVWLHYVALNMIYDDCPYLSSTIRHLCMSSFQDPEVMDDRRAICSAAVDRFDAVERAIDVEYVRRMNNPEINEHAQEIFVSVRQALLRNLHAPHFSKKSNFDQVYSYFESIEPAFGWSKMVFNVTEYDKHYVLEPTMDIGGTQVLELRCQFVKTIMNNKFRTVKDRHHVWDNSTNVPTVDFNAFYNRLEKTIFIQTPLLLEPTYGINRSQCLNYGTLGHIIGHEFMHAFEAAVMTTPEEWKELGTKSWQSQLYQVRREEEKCILDAYYDRRANSSGVLDLDVSKGEVERMLFEALADFGGMKFAYAAYENYTDCHPGEEMMLPGLKYTPRQLFWIMSGTYMCEKRTVEQSVPRHPVRNYYSERRFQGQSFRVNAPRMNHPGFLEDFKCKPGNKMYPSKTCDIMI